MSETQEARLDPALLRLLWVLVLGAVLALLDATVVNVGIDSLGKEFDSPLSTVQWVATGYLLAVAVMVPVAGWAIDRFGGRAVWLSGLGLFLVGSLLTGFSWNTESLIAFRVLTGFGGGVLEPTMLTLLARAAGPARTGRVMGLMSLPLMLGPVIGPVIGGVVLEWLNWQWLFFFKVPIGVLAVLLALKVVPGAEKGQSQGQPLDVLGVLLLCPGFAALMFAFSQAAGGAGFGRTRVVVGLVVGAALIVGYVVHALRTRIAPLIDMRLFSSSGFSASVAAMFLVGGMLYSLLFLVPLYYQQVRGNGVLAAGLLLAPQGIGALVGMPLAGRLSDRLGARLLVPGGAALVGLGTIGYTQAGADSNLVLLAVCSVISGFGLGMVGAPALASVYRTVPPSSAAGASSALMILNQIGGSMTVALVAWALASQTLASDLVTGFHHAFWWVVGAAGVVLLAGLLLPGRPQPQPAAQTTRPDANEPVTGHA
ncbi:DHA2 family efflux MFS transporter permease subunit [Streptomyces abyssomicinicus]|uniref:DHA2 family efflux MFS transporter permease subunit n=1 Tax=Streptomyces abyssomicinicus TaxID=574929 RepID=UPI0012509621|nr:DHA2 family efflux MFS transporter permease subunit [Streptomyces abyssomicinicus]